MNNDELYKIAVGARQFEIQMFWQRSNYFMVLNTALAVGFFALRNGWYAPLLAFVGAVVCLIWYLVNLGSKYWQCRWEEAASRLEQSPEAKLFAVTPEEIQQEVTRSLEKARHEGLQKWLDGQILKKPSVSYLMILVSLFFVVLWLIVLSVSAFATKPEPSNKAIQATAQPPSQMSNGQIVSIIFPIASVIVSLGAVWYSRRSYEASIQPVLVFGRRSEGPAGWCIENVGRGPALNVRVLDISEKDGIVSNVSYYPIAAGGSTSLCGIKVAWKLAAIYTDAYGRRWYTTRCGNNENSVEKGNKYPDSHVTGDEFRLRQHAAEASPTTVSANPLDTTTTTQPPSPC
jgi:hypothetical protein